MSEALTKEVFDKFDLKYAFDSGRRKAIIYGIKQPMDTLAHGSFHGSDQQTPNDRTSAEEQNEEEGKTPEEVALASKKGRHPRDSIKEPHFSHAYMALLEDHARSSSEAVALNAQHAFKLTKWCCFSSDFLEILKVQMTLEPNIELACKCLSHDTSMAGLVEKIKKLQKDSLIYDVE
ncbi:hypothetical protein HDU77_003884 [Chytriomyces hyalinus]|nr:hypothetical protein HDU77_003884 [Chytriomyces hyalinus]